MGNNINDALSLSRLALQRLKKIYFVGIGGIGMSSIAEILHALGHQVLGSDVKTSSTTDRLIQLGIDVFIDHCAINVPSDIDLMVITSAINIDNPEVIEAKKNQIPIISRGVMLSEIMRYRYGIAVAGTHGKTTTTSMLTVIFKQANLKPGFAIGGEVNCLKKTADIGEGTYFIAESDESDGSFLALSPQVGVITNIDYDHMQQYDGSYQKANQSFVDFARRIPFYGFLALNIDCPQIRLMKDRFSHTNTITFGFSEDADIQAINYKQNQLVSDFDVINKINNTTFHISLNMPGVHNILNALGAISVSQYHQIDQDIIAKALKMFQGVKRRFDVFNCQTNSKTFTLINDYGHHPQEIKATLQTIRSTYPNRRLIHLFQPHRYTRTKEHFNDFIDALKEVDCSIVLKTYAASENPSEGIDALVLAQKLRETGLSCDYADDHQKAESLLKLLVNEQDIVLVQGAGDVNYVASCISRW